jgi:hypothetical protein
MHSIRCATWRDSFGRIGRVRVRTHVLRSGVAGDAVRGRPWVAALRRVGYPQADAVRSTLSPPRILPIRNAQFIGGYVLTSFLCACTLIRTPRPMKSEISAVPP